jgi:hypothetical protein
MSTQFTAPADCRIVEVKVDAPGHSTNDRVFAVPVTAQGSWPATLVLPEEGRAARWQDFLFEMETRAPGAYINVCRQWLTVRSVLDAFGLPDVAVQRTKRRHSAVGSAVAEMKAYMRRYGWAAGKKAFGDQRSSDARDVPVPPPEVPEGLEIVAGLSHEFLLPAGSVLPEVQPGGDWREPYFAIERAFGTGVTFWCRTYGGWHPLDEAYAE